MSDDVRALVADEVKRYFSPKTMIALFSMCIALLFAVAYLWQDSRTHALHIQILDREMSSLKTANQISGQIDELNGTILAIAEALELDEKEDAQDEQ